MRYTVTSPNPIFSGDIVGVAFTNGTGIVDTDAEGGQAAYAYFQRADYALTPENEPSPDEPDTEDTGQHPGPEPEVHTFTGPEAGTDPDLTQLTEGEGL